jgi:hypothetical protein
MLTRRAILIGALTTGALLRPRTSCATASQTGHAGQLRRAGRRRGHTAMAGGSWESAWPHADVNRADIQRGA